MAVMGHATATILEQVGMGIRTNEFTRFENLKSIKNFASMIIVTDAMHTQRSHAEYLIKRGAQYVLTVKRNQRNQRNITDREPRSTQTKRFKNVSKIDKRKWYVMTIKSQMLR